MKNHFILLMRHAKRKKEESKGSPGRLAQTLNAIVELPGKIGRALEGQRGSDVLSEEGREETRSVAKRLKEFAEEWSQPLRLAGVLFAKSPEAIETAAVFREVYTPDPLENVDELQLLAPKFASQTTELQKGHEGAFTKELFDEIRNQTAKLQDSDQEGKALLVVGHQPFLSWIAYHLTDKAYSLAHSEILCLEGTKPGASSLLWCLSPSDKATSQKLHEKIRSKMTLANLLSGFITAGTGLLLPMLAEKEKLNALGVQAPLLFVAAGCLLVAVLLYLLTMFSYDALLMPSRFWTETPSRTSHRPPWIVARPPSAEHWILYQNMIRVWQWQFIPATFLTLSGLFLLWSGVFWGTWGKLDHSTWLFMGSRLSLFFPVAALWVVLLLKGEDVVKGWRKGWKGFWACPGIAVKFRYLCGPWLGSED